MLSLIKLYYIKQFASKIAAPACLITNQNKIIWHNENAKFCNNITHITELQITNLMNKLYITTIDNTYELQHITIGNKFFVIFQKTESIMNLWKELPFAMALYNKTLEITDANEYFQEIIGAEKTKLTELAKHFNPITATNGQELIWQTQFGLVPIITWIRPYGQQTLLILENKLEVIKLKNQAQEGQHLQILGQFTSAIAHDFNNLLTAIGVSTEELENLLPGNQFIQEIKKHTQLASNFTKELLNFVKHKQNEPGIVAVCEFLQSRQPMLKKLLGERIKLEIIADQPGLIDLSETQLEQIILNMIINSKDAMPTGGILSIIVRKIKIDTITAINKYATLDKGEYFVMEIIDTGSGIQKENIDKIFSPFFSTKANGTGLGLASCMRLVQHINGSIILKTSPKGTQFTIYLPISTKKEKQIIEQIEQNLAPKTILFAEDDEVIRTLVTKMLNENGHTVHAFANAQEALNAVKNSIAQFDCLITDAILIGMDGLELIRQIRKLLPNLPILLVSGYAIDDLEKCIPENVNYLPKPFTLKQFKTKLCEILNRAKLSEMV